MPLDVQDTLHKITLGEGYYGKHQTFARLQTRPPKEPAGGEDGVN